MKTWGSSWWPGTADAREPPSWTSPGPYREAGATGPMRALQDRMRKAGFRRAQWQCAGPRPGSGWPSLTQAENEGRPPHRVRVHQQGRQRGARHFGQHTGTHLRSVFAKLGVRSRVQLTNVMHQEEVAERRRDHQPRREARWTAFAGAGGDESGLIEAHRRNRQ